jgi:hypothetical protein
MKDQSTLRLHSVHLCINFNNSKLSFNNLCAIRTIPAWLRKHCRDCFSIKFPALNEIKYALLGSTQLYPRLNLQCSHKYFYFYLANKNHNKDTKHKPRWRGTPRSRKKSMAKGTKMTVTPK